MTLLNSFNCYEQSYFGWNLLYLSKKIIVYLTRKAFNTKFGPQRKDRESIYQVRQTLAIFCILVALILG